jgi:hypothetical protein
MHNITSKNAKKGDPVIMRVLKDVKVGDLVVIVAGTPVMGKVIRVKHAGMAWQAGRLAIQLDPITLVNGQQLRLESEMATQGAPVGKDASDVLDEWGNVIQWTQGAAFLFLPLAALQHGNQAAWAMGITLEAVIQSDTLLDVSSIKANQPLQTATPNDPGLVTIYFPKSEGLAANKSKAQKISCGELYLGDLAERQGMVLRLEPGRYWFRSQMKNEVVLDVEGGGDYYLRLQKDQSTPSHDMAMKLIQVLHDAGESESVGTVTSTTSKDLKSLSSRDIAKLLIQARSSPEK